MKRWIGLGSVVALLIAALVLAQQRKPRAEVSPDAVLHFIGDTEQELSRLPMSATRLSDGDEIRIGNELAEHYKYMEGLHNDTEESKEYRRYIEQVGSKVAARAQRKLPYRFHYIPDRRMINAFAIPGGHVYIGKGLLELMDSEDELASVLGHEVEHIDRRHAVERLQVEARLRHLGLLRLLVELPIEIFEAGYSKEQELEADREGTRLAVRAGYSPTGAIRMFEAFDRRFREAKEEQAKSPQEEAARVVLATMSEYFRSHPSSQERIAQIQNLITQERWSAHDETPFAFDYLLWTDRAQTALQQHKYKEAVGMATRGLTLNPNPEKARVIQGQAEFYQGNFAQAAESYLYLLKLRPNKAGYVQYYAFLLSVTNRKTAADVFGEMLLNVTNSPEATDSLAGLQLLAGNSLAADKIYQELRAHPEDVHAPDRLAWLGWWYYVLGDSPRALEMLGSAVQQRPGNPVYLVNYGWISIEQHRYADALDTLRNAASYATNRTNEPTHDDNALQAEVSMATAVAHWLADNHDTAIGEYQSAVNREPAWSNPCWYGPQYSATVFRAIGEIKAENDRRKKAAEIKNRQAQ
jgi:beta-barrel assembly-enhancing protease